MSEPIKLTPSYPPALEREGGCYPVKSMPLSYKIISWLVLFLILVVSFSLAGALFAGENAGLAVYPVLIGAFAALLYSVLAGRLNLRHVTAMQNAAREKCKPIMFHFSEDEFLIDCRNSKTRYNWSAIDEVVQLSTGTGLRVGVWVYPVSDSDLPEGLSGQDFRAQLEAWRSA